MPGPIEELRSARLALRRISDCDFDDMVRMHRDTRVMATLGGVRTAAQTRDVLASLVAHWDAHGFGVWTLREPATGRFVGRAGLRLLEVLGRPELELLYALMPEHWGRGLATEAAAVGIRVAFDELQRDDVVAFTMETNQASRRVMEKLGFRFERPFERVGLPHVLYRKTR